MYEVTALEASSRKTAALRFGAILAAQAAMYFLLLITALVVSPERIAWYEDGVIVSRSTGGLDGGFIVILLVFFAVAVAIAGFVASILNYRKYRDRVGHIGRQTGIIATVASCLVLYFVLMVSALVMITNL